ncbi:arginine--tRNA ligase [Paenibacillaceae bacterium]|nr:arginine--tRNA ligase [Paenibacillaceae bacterium]
MLKEWAVQQLKEHVDLSEEQLAGMLEFPPRADLGDIAFPCFALAKSWRKAPADIAGEIAQRIAGQTVEQRTGSDDGKPDCRVAAAGPYINFFYRSPERIDSLLAAVLHPEFATSQEGRGKRVVVDFSSPNIAKPFGIGHLRSTMIGNALANMYQLSGWEVVRINHIGDWGTQFGKLLSAYSRWGNDRAMEADPIKESLRLYVQFHEEAEQDPLLEEEAREWFRKLENQDKDALALWWHFIEMSLREFSKVYARLGVEFDHTLGESFYNDKMDSVVAMLQEQQLLEESDGAMVVRLDEHNIPPCLILKSDGSSIYATRDLATAFYRKNEMGADKLLYVVGGEQKLHFEQVFGVLGKLGQEWVEQCEHVAFGMMRYEGKKMSTRKGRVVFLNEVLDEAIAKAEEVIAAKNPALAGRSEIAEAIGIGAVVFGDLKHNRMMEADFVLEEALRFEGETGPYVQYTHARAMTLLEKGAAEPSAATGKGSAVPDSAAGQFLTGEEAWECLKQLDVFPLRVAEAVRLNEPSIVARYMLEVAKSFNRFYHQERIITEDVEERQAKLLLTAAVAKVLKTGLGLLGIKAPRQI